MPYKYTPLPPLTPFCSACSGALSTPAVAKYPASAAYLPFGVWYEATYTLLAVSATGVAKAICCHPDAVSLVKVP